MIYFELFFEYFIIRHKNSAISKDKFYKKNLKEWLMYLGWKAKYKKSLYKKIIQAFYKDQL